MKLFNMCICGHIEEEHGENGAGCNAENCPCACFEEEEEEEAW